MSSSYHHAMVAKKVKEKCEDLDVSNEWPEELNFVQFIKLLPEEQSEVIGALLEAATLNGSMVARREGYHQYPRDSDGCGYKKTNLEQDEVFELEQGKEKRNKRARPYSGVEVSNEKYIEISLFEKAAIVMGMKLLTATRRYYGMITNLIIIDWYYRAEDIKAWAERIGAPCGDLLCDWFVCQTGAPPEVKETSAGAAIFKMRASMLEGERDLDDTGYTIISAILSHATQHSVFPNANQVWQRLLNNPPSGCTVKLTKYLGEDALDIDGDIIGLVAFRKRVKRYLSKVDNKDIRDIKDKSTI